MSAVLADLSMGVLTLSLHRPHKKNALDSAMYRALALELQRAQNNSAIRAVVLLGSSDAFCAGNDLGDFSTRPPAGSPSPAAGFLEVLSVFTKPLLAGVCGPAVGIGATMLFHCDIVYAGSNAVFSLPFINLGLCPEAGSGFLAPALLGYQRAAFHFLTGKPLNAQEAHAVGWVREVFEPNAVQAQIQSLAAHIASKDLDALIETKRLLKIHRAPLVREQIQQERNSFDRLVAAPAAQRAFKRFLSARQPPQP